jgi:hypothetical protein
MSFHPSCDHRNGLLCVGPVSRTSGLISSTCRVPRPAYNNCKPIHPSIGTHHGFGLSAKNGALASLARRGLDALACKSPRSSCESKRRQPERRLQWINHFAPDKRTSTRYQIPRGRPRTKNEVLGIRLITAGSDLSPRRIVPIARERMKPAENVSKSTGNLGRLGDRYPAPSFVVTQRPPTRDHI